MFSQHCVTWVLVDWSRDGIFENRLILRGFLSLFEEILSLGAFLLIFILFQAYKPSLLVDLSYNDVNWIGFVLILFLFFEFKYLDKIGSIYFNLKSKIREIGNPLNNMLRMFMAPPCAAGEDNNQNSEELIDNMDDDDLLD